jgi:hypothetical protein
MKSKHSIINFEILTLCTYKVFFYFLSLSQIFYKHFLIKNILINSFDILIHSFEVKKNILTKRIKRVIQIKKYDK